MRSKKGMVSYSILVLVLFICHPITAHGNSSRRWFTEQPLTILPMVVVITLLLEVGIISFSNQYQTELCFNWCDRGSQSSVIFTSGVIAWIDCKSSSS